MAIPSIIIFIYSNIMSEEDGDVAPLRESYSKGLPNFIKRHPELFRIGLFEGIGTLILTYGVCCGQYLTPVRDKVPNPFYSFFISSALFIALCWSGPMTGGHVNPAVTLGQMFRAPKLPLRTALKYMIFQLVGAMIGSLIGTT